MGENNPHLRGAIEYKIREVIQHPKYEWRSFYYDVASVSLEKVNRWVIVKLLVQMKVQRSFGFGVTLKSKDGNGF